jgi:hypothetical protein
MDSCAVQGQKDNGQDYRDQENAAAHNLSEG